jgi:hypothetical protein
LLPSRGRFLLLFSAKSENTAPNNATAETIAAAMINGDGNTAVDIADEIRSSMAIATNIRISRMGMVLFIPVTTFFLVRFCLKAFLSTFLDSGIE